MCNSIIKLYINKEMGWVFFLGGGELYVCNFLKEGAAAEKHAEVGQFLK